MMKGGVWNVKQKPITTEVVRNVCVFFFCWLVKPHRRRSVVVFLVYRDVLCRKPLNVFFYIHLLHFSWRRATQTTTSEEDEERRIKRKNDRKSRRENNWANERIPIRAMRRKVIFPSATHTPVIGVHAMNEKKIDGGYDAGSVRKNYSLSFGLVWRMHAVCVYSRIFPRRLFENSLFPYFFCVDKTVRRIRRRLPPPLFLAFFANTLQKNINIFFFGWHEPLVVSFALLRCVPSDSCTRRRPTCIGSHDSLDDYFHRNCLLLETETIFLDFFFLFNYYEQRRARVNYWELAYPFSLAFDFSKNFNGFENFAKGHKRYLSSFRAIQYSLRRTTK